MLRENKGQPSIGHNIVIVIKQDLARSEFIYPGCSRLIIIEMPGRKSA